jgi:Asp-tRNA(Asn)/Glu-tRNA(Gln) amidotransferase B subunit
MGEVLKHLKSFGELRIAPEDLAELLALVANGRLNRNSAKEVVAAAFESGRRPRELVEERGLVQISDADTLAELAEAVLAAHPDQVARYRGGKRGLIGWFVGQAMARSGGQANPQALKQMLQAKLDGEG